MKKQLVIGMSALIVTAFAFEALAQRAPRTRVRERSTIETAPRTGEGAGAVGVRQRPSEGTVQTRIQPRSQNVTGARRNSEATVGATGQSATAESRDQVGVRAQQRPAAAAATTARPAAQNNTAANSAEQCSTTLGGVDIRAARVGGFIAADTCSTLADAGTALQARAARAVMNGVTQAKAQTGCDSYSCLVRQNKTEVFEDGVEQILVRETGMTAAQADANVNALRQECLKPGA